MGALSILKCIVIIVTVRGDPQGCQMLRLPYLLDNRLTGDGEILSLTRRPLFNHHEDSWYSFLLEAESVPGLEKLGQLKNSMTPTEIEPVTFRLVA
jgi:hypothetical protein